VSQDLTTLSDEELAQAAQGGSLLCFEELVNRYEKRIYRFLSYRINNRQDIEDLTQKTFIKAYRQIQRFNMSYKFITWIFTIARRLSISHYRSMKRTVDEEPEIIDINDPYSLLAVRDENNRLWKWLQHHLTEGQFSVLWMRYEEGLNIQEMSRSMKKSQSSIKVLLYRARQKVAHILPQEKSLQEPSLSLNWISNNGEIK